MKLMGLEQNSNLETPVSDIPTVEAIKASLENNNGSLDFLNKIVGEQTKTPQKVADDILAAKKAEESKPIVTPSILPEEPKKEEAKPAVPAEPKKEEPASVPEADVVEEQTGNKEENFKNLRKKLGETSTVLKEKEKALTEAQERIKKYEAGEEFPEVIKEKDRKIEELSRYERIVALRTSDAYKEKFIKPIEGIKSSLSKIAKDYELPEEELHKALEIKNARELNSFLSDHFDAVGALEVKGLIAKAQGLTDEAKEAEKEPQAALQEIEAEYRKAEEVNKAAQITNIVNKAKQAWVQSLNALRAEGKVKELIPSEIDETFNTNVVTPLQEKSASEYAKIVRILAENGLKELPEGLDKALAKMVQLSIASSFAIDSRELAVKEAKTLRENSERNNKYIRPLSSGGVPVGGGSNNVSERGQTPEQAAEAVVNKVLAKSV